VTIKPTLSKKLNEHSATKVILKKKGTEVSLNNNNHKQNKWPYYRRNIPDCLELLSPCPLQPLEFEEQKR